VSEVRGAAIPRSRAIGGGDVSMTATIATGGVVGRRRREFSGVGWAGDGLVVF